MVLFAEISFHDKSKFGDLRELNPIQMRKYLTVG